MTTKRPIAVRPALQRRRSLPGPVAPGRACDERDQEQAAALWLYAWSYDALRPTGDLLVARLARPAGLLPGRKVSRGSRRGRRGSGVRPTSR